MFGAKTKKKTKKNKKKQKQKKRYPQKITTSLYPLLFHNGIQVSFNSVLQIPSQTILDEFLPGENAVLMSSFRFENLLSQTFVTSTMSTSSAIWFMLPYFHWQQKIANQHLRIWRVIVKWNIKRKWFSANGFKYSFLQLLVLKKQVTHLPVVLRRTILTFLFVLKRLDHGCPWVQYNGHSVTNRCLLIRKIFLV